MAPGVPLGSRATSPFLEEKMCWKTLLLLLLYSDAQATLSHRWTRGELSFLYLFDAYDSFLNIIRNLEGWREQKEIRSPVPSFDLLSNALCFSTS